MSDPIGKLLSITWWREIFQKTGKAFGWGCAVVFGLPLVIGFGWNQFSGRNTDSGAAVARDAQLMTVNGDPVSMGDYYASAQSAQNGAPGEAFAQKSGMIIDNLVQMVVITQEAKRAGVKASDADIDKAIQDFKVREVGPKATTADLENYIYQSRHMSMADFREQVAKSFLGKALLDDAKKKTVVTEEEARNQTAAVRLNVVLIPIAPTVAVPAVQRDPRALSEEAAKQKAEALLAEVKSGKADIAAIAKANSSDRNAPRGGDTDFAPEYDNQGMMARMGMGSLGFGKEFDEAVHKAKAGEYVGVVKVTGFQPGYAFAKIAARRNDVPKDFAPQKVVDQLKEQRAGEGLLKKINDLEKVAKIEFPADRIEQKAYYDYYLVSKLNKEKFASFSNPIGAPSDDQIAKQKALAAAEIETVYKKDPTNTTAAVLILSSVQAKLKDPKTPPAEQAQLRTQLLPLYQSVIKASEGDNFEYRFGLGDALRDNKKFAEAYKNYHMVGHLMDNDSPTDLKAMQDAKQIRQRLEIALKTVASPEAPVADAEANAQEPKIQALDAGILQQQMKAAQERQAQEEQRKKEAELLKSKKPPTTGAGVGGSAPKGFGQSLDLGPGTSRSVTVPPADAAPKSAPAPKAPTTSVPSAKPTIPPPAGGPGR
jgi:hypothetical protein